MHHSHRWPGHEAKVDVPDGHSRTPSINADGLLEQVDLAPERIGIILECSTVEICEWCEQVPKDGLSRSTTIMGKCGLDKSGCHFVARVLIDLSNIRESKRLLLVGRILWLIDGLVPRRKGMSDQADLACIGPSNGNRHVIILEGWTIYRRVPLLARDKRQASSSFPRGWRLAKRYSVWRNVQTVLGQSTL
jgi:hypothetical protein